MCSRQVSSSQRRKKELAWLKYLELYHFVSASLKLVGGWTLLWNQCILKHMDSFSSHLSLPPLPTLFFFLAYSTFYIVGLILSMQIPFVGFQPIRTSEHMAAAGKKIQCLLPNSLLSTRKPQAHEALFLCIRKNTC